MRWSADKTRRERRAWLPKRCGDCGDVIWLEKLVASRDVYGNWTEVKCTVCEVMPRLVGKLSDALTPVRLQDTFAQAQQHISTRRFGGQ